MGDEAKQRQARSKPGTGHKGRGAEEVCADTAEEMLVAERVCRGHSMSSRGDGITN